MNRIIGFCMVAMLGLAGCADVTGDLAPQKKGKDKDKSRAAVLTDLQVVDAANDFSGSFTVTSLGYEDGELLVNGVLSYAAGGETVTQELSSVPATLSDVNPDSMAFQATRRCDILFLDLGPIFLDLLGLELDLSPIELDLDAVSGRGNLLGNLLCAVTGLLDGGPLASILELIDNINRILDGITT